MTGRADAALAYPERWALFLDIDGTLLNVAPTPDAVRVPDTLVPMLQDISHGLKGALAFLTGRRIADVDRLLAPLKLVGAGVHGTEIRTRRGGQVVRLIDAVPPDLVRTIRAVRHIAEGVLVEPKGAGVAVHYRNAPAAQPAIEAELSRIVAESSYDVALRRGRKVLEVVPRGFSKASALKSLLELPLFEGRRPIMIGDDVGDESALNVAQELGGLGLKVAGEHFGSATADFDGVSGVRAWLQKLAARLGVSDRTPA